MTSLLLHTISGSLTSSLVFSTACNQYKYQFQNVGSYHESQAGHERCDAHGFSSNHCWHHFTCIHINDGKRASHRKLSEHGQTNSDPRRTSCKCLSSWHNYSSSNGKQAVFKNESSYWTTPAIYYHCRSTANSAQGKKREFEGRRGTFYLFGGAQAIITTGRSRPQITICMFPIIYVVYYLRVQHCSRGRTAHPDPWWQ